MSWVPGDPDEPPRVGYVVGRRVGPAVVRNRLRRRLRALMRQNAPRLQPGAYLIGAGPEAAGLSFPQLEGLVGRLIEAVDKP
jgi:ribonuclease P protein component